MKTPLRMAALLVALAVVLSGVLLTQGCSLGEEPFRNIFPAKQELPSVSEKKQALNLYHEAWQVVFSDYVDSTYNGQNWYRWKDRYNNHIQTRDDAYAAIRTMLASLNDSYTRFLDPKKAEDQNMHIDARLSGVGIQIAGKDNQIVVISPLDDSPAKKAGIMPMDKIIEIDGEPTANMTIEDAVDKIRGPKGTPVNLTILRDGKRLTFKLVRDEIVIKTVFGEAISKDIGYIRVSSFISQDTPEEMRSKLEAQQHTKALIIDIRGNNGGLLPNALEISDMFLKDGDIVSIVDRNGTRKTFSSKRPQLYDKPLVVLIDEGSASASEILGGALKDNKRATLIGSRTFGKGLVQKINYLQDGSELNLTISKYFTPLGLDIDKKGIAPDIAVDYTEEDIKNDRDPQKEAAIQFLKKRVLASAS
jgi:carboxyl-terminal processing protease